MEQPDSPTKLSMDKSVSLKEEEQDDYEDIPQEEYEQLLKEMEAKKEQDEENQVEGRQTFDYTVPIRRKKQRGSEQIIESPSPTLLKQNTVDNELMECIKEKVEATLTMFDSNKHWYGPLEEEVKRLCLLEEAGLKLFIWVEKDDIQFTTDIPKEINKDTTVVFKLTNEKLSQLDGEHRIIVRKIQKNHLKSLVTFMNNVFIPTIMSQKSWPDNVKKQFLAQLHKFMTSITQACFQLQGYTELYIPKEDLSNSDGQDKDLIQRLQTTIIQWNRQIKEIVSNPDSHQDNENSGPLNQIQYWRNRRENLKHIDQQLENAELKAIVKFLQKMDSNDARGFGELAQNIKAKSQQAQNNLIFLQSLYEPCKNLENAQPKQIPDMLPQLLKRVRMIWHHSKFYNSNDRITNLLNKISNQIIQRCKAQINVDDMLDGDVQKCIEDLNDAIQCGKRWRQIYDRFADVINTTENRKWNFSTNSIFASVEAFVQRCSELIQICQGQLQFALKGKDNQLPKFGGARASEIVGILLQIKGAFVKLIDKFKANKKEKILDVKASNWHQEYNTFKSGVKELDVMYQNVIDFAFKQVTTVEQGVNMLEAFDYLAKRDSIKTCVKKKAIEVMNLFIGEIQSAKQEIQNKKDPNVPLHHGKYSGGAILIRSVIFRLEKFKDKIDKLYFIDDNIKATALEKYTITVKQLESLIKDQKLAVWKEDNKGFEESGHLNKSVESVTILCRPDENSEDYKLPLQILRPKPHHIECNFDRKLFKLLNEVSTWKILIPFNVRIPNEPDQFVMNNRENLRVLRQLSMVVVREYNQIIDFMDDNERNLFAEHLQATNKVIQPGITRFKWSSKANVDSFLGRTCRGVCSDLYNKLKEFKANTDKIEHKCQEIASKLFLKINKKHSYQIDEFYDEQKDHREDIKDKLQKILKEIADILTHSYELFAAGRKETQLYWFNYVKQIDRKIEDSLKKGIKNSLVQFYVVIGDPEKNIQPTPIFVISAILQRDDPPKLAYKPTTSSLLQTITEIISSINDVVSGFPKIQNKMYDIYKKRRDDMLVRMQKEKNPNRKAVQEEQIKPLQNYLYYKISDDVDIQKYSSKIINNLNKVCNEVTKDSTKDKWTNSPLFWQNKRKQKFIKNVVDYNWMDISQLKQQIENSNAQSEQIQEIKSSHPIGCINLDDSRFKTTLSEIVILWQNMFMSYLQERCIDQLKSLHDLFKTSEANLTPQPQNLQELKKNTDLWQELMNNREQFQKKLDPLKDKFAQLDMHSIQLKEEENKLRATLMDAWLHYNEMLLQIEKRNQRVRGVFQYQAKKNKDDFLKEAFDLKVNFQQNAPFQSTYTNETAFNNINEYNDLVKGLRARWNDMIFGFELFQISYTSPADLDHVDKQIKNLSNIWQLKEDWDQNYKSKVKDIKFHAINCEELEQYADDYIYKLNGLSKESHIKRWGITISVRQAIQNFKQVLPLIDFLRKPFIRPRHWQQLRSHIDFDPDSQNFTLDQIYVQKNFIGYSDTINNTCEVAQEEYKIESALDKIKKEWEHLELATEQHKKTWKVKGTDAIFATLQDNMGVLSTQKTGLFYENFKDEIETWENNLQKISQTLQMLVQVQRQWIYLQAIFASQQDQDRQLIGDINKFQHLNTKISVHMDRIHSKPNILTALLVENFYNELDEISKRLDESQKVLNSLLQTKRGAFPRFYFLANDDLFQLLGNSRDPAKVNKHIKKCFEGIKKLAIASTPIPGKKPDNFNFDVVQLLSPEQQSVKLINKVPVENGVQNWLRHVERQMRESLKKYLYSTFITYCKKKDPKAIGQWVQSHHGQLLITASQIYWTSDCENILRAVMNSQKPDKGKAWKGLKQQKSFFLSQLTKQVRRTTKTVNRLKLIALITIQVHARDITDILSKTCFSVNSFQWKKQVRFRATLQGQSADCTVQQTNTAFPYGFQYQGNNGRLVVTSLTDRCYMTLTTAMHLKKGGAPQGPAGTGKTQTVKDLGKGLAKFVVVFNCSEGLDYKSLGRMFSGLMQTGGWGCFDQFNRIELEVLSVVAQQMLAILNALKQSKKLGFGGQNMLTFNFQGSTIPLNDQCAIFITMNPGYAGRSQLPDNLKSLFRPISMMVPQSTMICQIMLSSQGFKYGKPISNKIVVLYQLMAQQLSKQDHYDFGLRAIKSVLTCAGAIRRDSNIESGLDKVDKKDKELIKQLEEQELNQEILILMKAIMDMNIPKFVSEDVPLFNSLFNDLFPNMEMQEMNNEQFLTVVEAEMKKAGLVPKPQIIRKIVQLYDSKNTRHGNMLVGTSMSGKSTCWKVLKSAMNTLNKENPKKYPQVKHEVLNPKAVDLKQLFGFMDMNGQWHEGVLSSMMSRLCKQQSQAQRWMILDGPVDTLWIESMNTVLDDNKVLTLLNGDRINLPPQVGLVFEVEDLAVASPATVSRAGMIYVNLNDLGWRPYFQSWLQAKVKEETVQDAIKQLVEKWFGKLFQKKRLMKDQFRQYVPSLQVSIIIAFTKLFDSFLSGDGKAADFNMQNKPDNYFSILQKWFIFCMVWSFGGTLDQIGRKTFDLVMRDIESFFPGNFTVFDYYINADKGDWQNWQEKVNNMIWKPSENASYHSLLVPTVDSARTKYVLQTCVVNKVHTLSVGVTGTGKTVLINQILAELDQSNWKINNIIYSSQTSSQKTQDMIEGKMVRRTKTKMVPDGKKMVIYVDDLNMPKKDTYFSQPPLELLRQWMDYGGWFDRTQNQIFKKIEDIQFVTSMGPPGGGRNQISRRIQTKFTMINFMFPSEAQVRRIFHNILSHKFVTQKFQDQIRQISQTLAYATINLYNSIAQNFLPTPAKSHYMFNMRDISKVIQGIYIFDRLYCDSKLTIYRLWVHQCLRVFHDRLVNDKDRERLKKVINDQLEQTLQSSMKECTDNEERETIFVDFFDSTEDRQIYIEVVYKQREELKKIIQDKLVQFNQKFKSAAMNITLFQTAISYVCRINRIIKFQRGHGMLVGQGGAGRHSLTKLATFIAKYNLCQVTISKGFKLKEFREKIKEWSQECAFKDNGSSVFMFSDNQITEESFVEDINTILTIGEIPNLFGKEDMLTIKEKMKKVVLRMLRDQNKDGKEVKDVKDEVLISEFYNRIQNNFHIVFLMSKTGDNLRNYGRMYPGLINNTTIIYFMPWPTEALFEVANNSLKNFDFDETLRGHIAQFFSNAHTKVMGLADKMWKQLKRVYYVTPTNYIELVKGYCQLLNNKREEIGSEIQKLAGGLGKLDDAQANSNELQKNLAVFNNELGKKSKDCEELMIKIDKQTRESKDKKNQLAEREAQVNKEKSEMQHLKADAEADLKKAQPALVAAELGLANLTKDKLSVVKSYSTPPGGVDVVLNAVMILLNKEPSWAVAKKELADTSFLSRLQTIDKGRVPINTLKRIEKLTQDPKMQIDRIDTISEAAGGLWRWVLAVEGYAKAFKDIEPKKNKVNNLMEKLKKSQQELQHLRDNFSKVQEIINGLNSQLEKAKSDMQSYKVQTQQLQIKLERAQKLITGLGSTKQGWKERKEKLQQKYSYIIGDSLMTAAFLSYAGPFPSEYRNTFLNEDLLGKVRQFKISHSKDYNFPEFLVKPVDFIKWGLKGLPDDQFSKENGVLVRKGRMFPLMIDPQLQGNRWIREMEKENKDKFIILDPQTDNYMKTIQLSVANGNIVLLQNLQEQIDSSLEPLLNKTIKKVADRYMIYLGDKDIRYNENFRLFMTTKLPNPRYKPEVTTKVILVNFTVKEKGLQEQLTSVVIQRMEMQLENSKNELIKNKSDNEQKMKKIDDGILKSLSSAKTSLIDDENIISYLQESKETEEKVRHQIESSIVQMKKINLARENYKKLAKVASKLFFIINDFALIDSMYQFSLDAYIGLFQKTIKEYIEKPGLNDSLNEKLDAIADKLKTGIYRYACRGLFQKDKLLLGFMMTIRLKQVDPEEYNFFLKGGKDLNVDRKAQPMNPNEWIEPMNWNTICDLEKLPNFPNIIGAFIHNAKEWKKWYMSANPEKEPLPGQWNQKCDSLRKLIITKIIRRDRVIPALINFIVDKNGNETFVHPPNPSLESVYADSNKNTPIVFILSPGVDPYAQLAAFAKTKEVLLVDVSLGQGQAKIAKEKVNEGARNGSWLYLANCHLSLGFLKDLQKLLETFEMNKNDVNDKFRLWLSTNPHPKFPISILQRCVKITTQPPKGMKANMLRLYQNMPKQLHETTAPNKAPYRRVLYSLCWYHSLIIERKRFKTLGWNIIYDFNDSDWDTADKILQIYIEHAEEVRHVQSSVTGEQPVIQRTPPWDAIRYLISEVTYGGRVTDDWDRRLLNVYAAEYFNQAVISEEKHRLGSPNLPDYIIPEEQPQKERAHEPETKYYCRKIEEFPANEKPQVFGQHINAQISSQIADTNILLDSLDALQASTALTGDSSAEDKVKQIIAQLMGQVDEPFNEEEVYEKVKPQDQNPLKIVLIQEISRYNKLLKLVRKNLMDLEKGINGLVLISEELQVVMNCLFENKVPEKWKFAYYSLKPLSLWMADLNKRVDQLRVWVHKGQPNVFWISGFSFPTGFTTALQQQASRKANVPIDQFIWEFSFQKLDTTVMGPAKQGAYISGLWLEGAKWDGDKNCITEPQPMKLFYRMPIIQFKPIFVEGKQKPKKGQNLYACPTYMYPIRTGVVERKSYMFTVMLPIKPGINNTGSSDQDFWTKRGAALLMSLAGEEL